MLAYFRLVRERAILRARMQKLKGEFSWMDNVLTTRESQIDVELRGDLNADQREALEGFKQDYQEYRCKLKANMAELTKLECQH